MAGLADRGLLSEMLFRITHRGPDDQGTFIANGPSLEGRVAFGTQRLSIIDLSPAGHQPLSNEDGTVWVAYNGEIYNFKELRDELIADGHTFRSHTDTEVLVHLYEKYGRDLTRRLNGMYAFALWDASRQELLLCRDRMGIKPLYYVQVGSRLYFGSEVKSLLASPEVHAEMNPAVLPLYLSLLYVPGPETMFRGVRKLLPGQMLIWSRGGVSMLENPRAPQEPFDASEEELTERLRELLVKATHAQMMSDVPLGFFLSGGLDSSTLLACAALGGSREMNCFSIAFSAADGRLEQNSDDAVYARQVARHFGAKFHEIVVEPKVADLLPKAVYHLDEPIADHAAIATFLICKAAQTQVKVLLSGQGADEIFGGYRVHLTPAVCRRLRLVPSPLRKAILGSLVPYLANHSALLPGGLHGLALAASRYGQRMLPLVDMEPWRQYANARSYLSDGQMDELLLPEVRAVAARSAEQVFFELFGRVADRDFIDQMLYADTQTFLPDFNLAYSDKMSMAASVEVRVPFLDDTVVDFMERVPASLKIRGGNQKYLLRQAMRTELPRDVIRRRKAGFGLPVRSWIRTELREMVEDLLSPGRVKARGLFAPAAVGRMVAENRRGDRDWTLNIWGLLTLELWQQTFLDSQASSKSPVVAQHHV